MKKITLIVGALFFYSTGIFAQQKSVTKYKTANETQIVSNNQNKESVNTSPSLHTGQLPNRGCATKVPTKQWDEWFNQKVADHKKQNMVNGRTATTTYTIPIIFHVVSYTATGTVPIGTYPNLSQAQINSQVPILNADYGGTGFNSANYAGYTLSGHQAFYDYAVVNSLPAPDNNGTIIANTGITFCLAAVNPSGVTLAEPGIDRINSYTLVTVSGYSTNDPGSSALTIANFSNFIDTVIKPPTIWDPTRYFNVWLTDCNPSVGLLGYSTFPSGTTLSGLSGGGSGNANTTTDGCWVLASSCGNTGSVSAPYQYGRTLTHESGHYFGLRHIWGDGTCLTDYCNDTPPAAAANYVGCPTAYPYHAGTCTGSPSNAVDGEMFMNFMDYSDDCAMFMFTTDQVTRMQTTLAQCPDRNGLTSAAVTICNLTVSTPTAAFTLPSGTCVNQPLSLTDASSGPPTSWNWSVSPSTGVTITTNTISNPTIIFTNPGTYTVTDAVSNSAGSNSVSHTIITTTCSSACDTLSNFLANDTLTIFKLNSDSGYISGNNLYGDLAKAEFYSSTALSGSQITGVICLFYKNGAAGTKGTGTVSLDIFNGTAAGGPTGTAVATATASLASIVATTPVTHVDYCANPALAFASPIMIPYKFSFASPVATPSVGFVASLNLPTTTGDTLVVFQNTQNATAHSICTAWELNAPTPGTWASVQSDWGLNNPVSFAILPIVCGITVGIPQNNMLADNIAFFPNPSNGQVSFAITLDTPTDLTVSVVNMLGQLVSSKIESNVSHAVLNYDFSSLGKGVYFVNIIDSHNNKTIKKMIIQ